MTDELLRRDDESVTSFLGRRSLSNEISNTEETMSKPWQMPMTEPTPKKPRTSEDFKLFCKFILEYENYDASDKDESLGSREKRSRKGKGEKSSRQNSSSEPEEPRSSLETSSDDNDSFDLITCFCGKPFAGRPMIECSKCFTWIHLRCAKVKKSDIPEIFICSHCKESHKK